MLWKTQTNLFSKNGVDIGTWMFSDAIGKIRPEILECDQDTIKAAIERVLAKAKEQGYEDQK